MTGSPELRKRKQFRLRFGDVEPLLIDLPKFVNIDNGREFPGLFEKLRYFDVLYGNRYAYTYRMGIFSDYMTSIAFDTLKFSKRLVEAGFTEQQAEALAAAEAEIIENNLSTKRDLKELEVALKRDFKELETSLKRDFKELDTSLKRDFRELETSLKRDIEELKANLIRDMKDLEYRMTIKLGAMLAVAVGAMAALGKIL